MNGKIYLLPNLLGDSDTGSVIPANVVNITTSLRYFIVENIRTTRRYLRKLDANFPIDDSHFFELNKHLQTSSIEEFLQPCFNGMSVGIMSEAGVPGIADPGADVVALAHSKNLQIIPLVGPSSIIMAMMASGLNGQNFAFNGYLPIKTPERIKRLKQLEQKIIRDNQAQLFIETPYRNNALLSDMLQHCLPNTKLCVAANISCSSEFIKTQSIGAWKKEKPDLNKIPTLFILGI